MKHVSYKAVGAAEQWDYHGAFHKRVGPFTIFSTGEWCILNDPDSHDRKEYSFLDAELILTSVDSGYTYKTKDGEPITKAALNRYGGQTLLRDLETGLSVCVSPARAAQRKYDRYVSYVTHLPRHMLTAMVWSFNGYCNGPNYKFDAAAGVQSAYHVAEWRIDAQKTESQAAWAKQASDLMVMWALNNGTSPMKYNQVSLDELCVTWRDTTPEDWWLTTVGPKLASNHPFYVQLAGRVLGAGIKLKNVYAATMHDCIYASKTAEV